MKENIAHFFNVWLFSSDKKNDYWVHVEFTMTITPWHLSLHFCFSFCFVLFYFCFVCLFCFDVCCTLFLLCFLYFHLLSTWLCMLCKDGHCYFTFTHYGFVLFSSYKIDEIFSFHRKAILAKVYILCTVGHLLLFMHVHVYLRAGLIVYL